MYIVEHLSDFHCCLHFASAFRLLPLNAYLDQLGGKLVCPHLTLAVHMRLVVVRQHLHVLLNAEERVFDRSLLDEREKHRRNVSLPRNLVVLLKDL